MEKQEKSAFQLSRLSVESEYRVVVDSHSSAELEYRSMAKFVCGIV